MFLGTDRDGWVLLGGMVMVVGLVIFGGISMAKTDEAKDHFCQEKGFEYYHKSKQLDSVVYYRCCDEKFNEDMTEIVEDCKYIELRE